MKFFGSSKKNKGASGTKPYPPQNAIVPACDPSWQGFEQRNASRPGHLGLGRLTKSTTHLPMPSGWPGSDQPPVPPLPSRYAVQPYAPPPPNIVVNQHYYISAPPESSHRHGGKHGRHAGLSASTTKLNLGSVVNLASDILPVDVPHFFDDGLPSWHAHGTRLLNQGAACYDQISSKFNNVMTLIDSDRYKGNEGDLFSYGPLPYSQPGPPAQENNAVALQPHPKRTKGDPPPKGQTTAVATSLISGNYFAKVDLYANSKLPPDLPPLRLYIATYPLLSLAAAYSDRVYQQPTGLERFAHIDADWKTGTKAMVIKSVPMDHAHTIVFAVRGTATFMDWAVNLNMSPTSPTGFLDDLGNFCHAGFLSVARKMIRPVAARLRQLLEEDPGRASYSLLITGHSAGGAVAALLYSHMLATSKQAESELNLLTGCFRRVHCITFGTPPVSLLPLQKPDHRHLKKSLFLSFVNEGDPVARADKAYVKSLLELFRTSVPGTSRSRDRSREPSKERRSETSLAPYKPPKTHKAKSHHGSSHTGKHGHRRDEKSSSRQQKPVWKVPPATLSNAGRLVVLRSGKPLVEPSSRKTVEERLDEGVVAQVTSDEELRQVIWGDPVCHVMKLYAGRIETLAIGAVTAP